MRILFVISFFFIFVGCNDSLDPDIDIQENLIVVDGWIYNDIEPTVVKVSRSVAFESPDNSVPVTAATVIIRDTRQNEIRLTETSPGTYASDTGQFGKIGLSYQLVISLPNGDTYISEFESLNPVPLIETLILEPDVPESVIEDIEPIFYFPVVFVDEFEEKGDFYRWKIARNEQFFNSPEDIILQTDRFVNGNLFKNEFKEYLFESGDSSTVRIESLTEDAYNFLRFFRRQTTDLGTSGGTNPGALRGNMQNINDPDKVVLGYFGASAVSMAGKTVEE